MANLVVDLSGSPYLVSYFARGYVDNPLHINLTTGHTMLSFDPDVVQEFLNNKMPYSKDFLDGQMYMLTKFSAFFNSLYEKGQQPHPKYLLKSLEFLTEELMFNRTGQTNQK